jgi:hypothetical protein
LPPSIQQDATVRVWNDLTGACLAVLSCRDLGHVNLMEAYSLSGSGRPRIAVAVRAKVEMWDGDSFSEVASVELESERDVRADANSLHVYHRHEQERTLLAVGRASGDVNILDGADGRLVRKSKYYIGPVKIIRSFLNHDGSCSLVVAGESTVSDLLRSPTRPFMRSLLRGSSSTGRGH